MKLVLLLLLMSVSSNAFALTWESSGTGTFAQTENSIIKTGGSGWNPNVKSLEQVSSGDVSVEAIVTGGSSSMFGLQSDPLHPTGSYQNLAFAIQLDTAGVFTIENNPTSQVIRGAPLAIGDRIKVAIEGAEVAYYIDRGNTGTYTELYRNTSPNIAYPIGVGTSIFSSGSGFTNIVFGSPRGVFKAFTPSSPSIKSVSSKGGLLTSDGTKQIQIPACADTEALGYDSSTESGFICVTN